MPNSIRSDSAHVAEHAREYVEVVTTTDARRLRLWRAVLSALIAGLGALAAALQTNGDAITLGEGITALAAAVAAAGAIYGVNPAAPAAITQMPRRDLEQIRVESERRAR